MNREEKLRELMLRYLEGEVEPEELERLNQAVETDLAARRQMAELMLQETLLTKLGQESEFFELQSKPKAELRPASLHSTSRILKIQRLPAPARWGGWSAVAAAAAMLFAVSLYLAVQAPRETDSVGNRMADATPEVVPPPQPESPVAPPAPVDVKPATPPSPAPKAAPTPVPVPAPRKPKTETAKVPAPPAPLPEPGPQAPPPPANVTPPLPPSIDLRTREIVIAKIERVQGDVNLVMGDSRIAVKPGQDLACGQGLETGALSSVLLKFADGTRIELGPRGAISDASEKPFPSPKRIRVLGGTVTADVTKQNQARPMLLLSPHGEVKVLGTSFKVAVDAESMRVDVKEGKVQVTRKEDRASVDVGAGFYVTVSQGLLLEVRSIPPPDPTNKAGRPK